MARKEFTAAEMRELLGELDKELQRLGKAATIFVVGGAAMALAYNAERDRLSHAWCRPTPTMLVAHPG